MNRNCHCSSRAWQLAGGEKVNNTGKAPPQSFITWHNRCMSRIIVSLPLECCLITSIAMLCLVLECGAPVFGPVVDQATPWRIADMPSPKVCGPHLGNIEKTRQYCASFNWIVNIVALSRRHLHTSNIHVEYINLLPTRLGPQFCHVFTYFTGRTIL